MKLQRWVDFLTVHHSKTLTLDVVGRATRMLLKRAANPRRCKAQHKIVGITDKNRRAVNSGIHNPFSALQRLGTSQLLACTVLALHFHCWDVQHSCYRSWLEV